MSMYNNIIMKKKIKFLVYLLFSISLLFFPVLSCSSQDKSELENKGISKSSDDNDSETKDKKVPGEEIISKTLTLSFSGDVMAHDTNYKMKDYNKIYDACRSILLKDDLTFGNIEMPVCDTLKLSSFPRFNVHSNYLKAAIDGGFDVFSFANNHTNDQKIKGMQGTLKSIKKFQTDYAKKNRKLYYCGIREKNNDPMKATLIEKDGWKILFLAVTECLNSHDASKKRVYLSYPNKKGRALLLKRIQELRKNNPCDIFVLSLHLYEKEYGRKVLDSKKQWFEALAKAGIDIVWAQHPHVLQSWEVKEIKVDENTKKQAFFMYSMGNFISGQRRIVHYDNPNHYREYTGDSAIMQLILKKKLKETYTDKSKEPKIEALGNIEMKAKPILITNYKSKDGMVVKLFTKEWAESRTGKEKKYFLKRFELMHNYLPLKKISVKLKEK